MGNDHLNDNETRCNTQETNLIGHPPIQWVPGALSLGVNRPSRETDHSPRRSKRMCGFIPPPPPPI